MNRNSRTQSICPACIDLPEWQWTMFTEAEDFCETHAWQRYPAIPITDEEIWEAQAARNADYYGWDSPLDVYFPDKLRRCRACGTEWIGTPNEYSHLCPISVDGEMVYGPYRQNQIDEWEDDCYTQPTHLGTHKQSH